MYSALAYFICIRQSTRKVQNVSFLCGVKHLMSVPKTTWQLWRVCDLCYLFMKLTWVSCHTHFICKVIFSLSALITWIAYWSTFRRKRHIRKYIPTLFSGMFESLTSEFRFSPFMKPLISFNLVLLMPDDFATRISSLRCHYTSQVYLQKQMLGTCPDCKVLLHCGSGLHYGWRMSPERLIVHIRTGPCFIAIITIRMNALVVWRFLF
jgi:hypothetical protein